MKEPRSLPDASFLKYYTAGNFFCHVGIYFYLCTDLGKCRISIRAAIIDGLVGLGGSA